MLRQKNFTFRSWIKSILMLCFAVSLTACDPHNMEEELAEAQTHASENALASASVLRAISIANVNLTVSPQATGTVTLQLRDSSGTLIATAIRPVSTMASKGKPAWYTFMFRASYEASPHTRLRLYITRSDAHNAATRNTVYVSTSLTDDYLGGGSSLAGKDISFITYTNKENYFLTDQVQGRVRDKQPLQSNLFVWQEFTFGTNSGSPVDLLTSTSFNFTSVTPPSGELTVRIMNGQGTETLEEVTVRGVNIIPVGGEGWSIARLSNPLIVSRGQKYRMQFSYRSLDAQGDTILAGHVIGFESAYPFGTSSLTGDFAFFTETTNGIDQYMDLFTYRYELANNQLYWQEFVPGAH